MAIFCVHPEESQRLEGHDWIVAYGYSDEAISIQSVNLIHQGPDPKTPQPDPNLNVIGTLLNAEPTFWVAHLPSLRTEFYHLEIQFLYAGFQKSVAFPTMITIIRPIVEVLYPKQNERLDPNHFVTYGTQMGGGLPLVQLKQDLPNGHGFQLTPKEISKQIRWCASKKLIPINGTTKYTLVVGGPPNEINRSIAFDRLARQLPIPN